MSEKQTVFFILNTGEAVRNFATHGVLQEMIQRNYRCVLFGLKPQTREYFRAALGDAVDFADWEPKDYRGVMAMAQRLITYSWRTRIAYGDVLVRHGAPKRWTHPLQNLMGFLLRPVPAAFWEWLYVHFASDHAASALLDQHKPVAVCISNPVSSHNVMANLAKGRGITTACLLESWDNLTIRGGLFAFHDLMFTWNDLMSSQAIGHHKFPARRVHAIGIPSFDIYQHNELFPSEEEWRRQMGIRPGIPVIVYSTSSVLRSKDEFDNLDGLIKARDEGHLPRDLQFLVRIHPRDNIGLYDRYQTTPDFTIQPADCGSDGHNSTLGRILMLAATMRYASVVANIFSTIMLDAFTQGKPVVAVAFDPKPRAESQSVTRFLRDEHVRNLMKFDAVPVAYAPDELIAHLSRFLREPDWKKAERERCCLAHLTHMDGKCSARFADILEKRLKSGS